MPRLVARGLCKSQLKAGFCWSPLGSCCALQHNQRKAKQPQQEPRGDQHTPSALPGPQEKAQKSLKNTCLHAFFPVSSFFHPLSPLLPGGTGGDSPRRGGPPGPPHPSLQERAGHSSLVHIIPGPFFTLSPQGGGERMEHRYTFSSNQR